MKKKYIIVITGLIVLLLVITGYTTWNALDPDYTCAKCHEIAPSHITWLGSAHADVRCIECHGTALSDGFRSMKEKARMVYIHFTDSKYADDIRLITEEQILTVNDRCIQCHQSEYAGWLASGHAVNYREIFMNIEHNNEEKPYWDCFRCHGMFYEGNINDLMNLEGEPSSWSIYNMEQELRPTIPCLACHQMHTENPVSERYVSTTDTTRLTRNTRTSIYLRADKMYLRSDMLTPVEMIDGDQPVNRAIDPNTLLCQQCHAPDYIHRADSQDDRTPVGVHEGISCTACHKVHSGDTRESCVLCHSEISKNCRIDVRTLNTTFVSKNSPNDIHRLTCVSCHEQK